MGHQIAIFGASGYAGGELVRLVDSHPSMEVAYLGAHSRSGFELGEVHPHLPGGKRELGPLSPDRAQGMDLAFLALPHGASAHIAHELRAMGVPVVDLGSDFRMDTPERYQAAYGTEHPFPDQLPAWVYGLPEFFRKDIAGSATVAAPGCYPTAVSLALAPLAAAGLIDVVDIVVSAVSGVSGAGRGVKENLQFGAVDESVTAYGVGKHRHRPEMEQVLEAVGGSTASVTFTPHLVPMQRGLLASCHARTAADTATIAAALHEAYDDSTFVDVVDAPPSTRWVVGSNRCLIHASVDEETSRVVVVSVIDNLLKGAAGQAVQCGNLMLGLPEPAGLPLAGWMP